eukprot:m.9208 g.9208  ORF g.9208 m.9208 type:complete len:68 (+) comp5660_c0_seq1:1538-1741(+)
MIWTFRMTFNFSMPPTSLLCLVPKTHGLGGVDNLNMSFRHTQTHAYILQTGFSTKLFDIVFPSHFRI